MLGQFCAFVLRILYSLCCTSLYLFFMHAHGLQILLCTLFVMAYCVTISGRYNACIKFALLRLMILFVPRRRFELFVFCLFFFYMLLVRALSQNPKQLLYPRKFRFIVLYVHEISRDRAFASLSDY